MARTAAEVLAELERDPAYRARREMNAAEVAALAEQRRLAAEPVFADLRSAGVELDSFYQLHQQPDSYPLAIPVLLEHMSRDYPERVLLDIGHALPGKADASWWSSFKSLYLSTPSAAVRDRLAAAMAGIAVRRHYGDLLEMVRDPSLGQSRIYFLSPIHRIGNRIEPGRGRAEVHAWIDDPDLAAEVRAVLRRKSRRDT